MAEIIADSKQISGEVHERNLYFKTIEKAQNLLAEYANPDSNITPEGCIDGLIGILDDKELVKTMRGE
jgi:hypothetical protein